MVKVTKNFTYKELIHSDIADEELILNEPNLEQQLNLARLANLVLQPIRTKINKPIKITSGFRSKMLNEEVKGAENSFHLNGAAADCTSPGKVGITHEGKYYTVTSNFAIFYHCLFNPNVDHVIHEYGEYGHPAWVHVAVTRDPSEKPRRYCMRKIPNHGYIHVYEKEILDMIKSSQSVALSL